MKRYTSRFLKAIAITYFFFPLFYVTLITVIFDIPLGVWIDVFLRPYFYILCGLCMATGYGLWEMKRWSWHLFLGINILITYETSQFVFKNAQNSNKSLAFLGIVGVFLGLTYRLGKEIRVPYFFPKIRWWESDPRYRLAVPARVASDDASVESTILDLSMGGCFVKLRDNLRLDDKVQVHFTVFGILVDCEGVVVWVTDSSVTHPRGVGLKFQKLTRVQRKALRNITQRLRQIAAYYKRSRHTLTPEEFAKGVKEIEGKIFPS